MNKLSGHLATHGRNQTIDKNCLRIRNDISVTVLNDGTSSNDDRLGAVADIRFTIKAEDLGLDDVLVIAGREHTSTG